MPYEKQDLFDVGENGVQSDICDAIKRPETVTRNFYHDPGHGWLEVKRSELRDLGLLGVITPCSYQKGPFVYLEEDCDAQTYVNALKERGQRLETIDEYQDPTPIRNYCGYRP